MLFRTTSLLLCLVTSSCFFNLRLVEADETSSEENRRTGVEQHSASVSDQPSDDYKESPNHSEPNLAVSNLTSAKPEDIKESRLLELERAYVLEQLDKAYEGKTAPEGIRMYLAILRGSQMRAGEGWFGPSQLRYTWQWLAERQGIDESKSIARDQFRGPKEWFSRLDRNHNGLITSDDFDWSERNPWVQNAYLFNRLFRSMEPSGDGKLTRQELLAFFDSISEKQEYISSAQLRDFWISSMMNGFLPGDAPTKDLLLRGLFAGEVGSLHEGPNVGDSAPDFTLQSVDQTQSVQLSSKIGTKPVVLVFGNFTCGPFRSMYPEVDEIARRFGNDAEFLAVYVREAHPTDGWVMKSNDKVGVSVAQPTSLAERRSVAEQCTKKLDYSIPLLIDDIDDAVGHAYSGMPARMYVIDTSGRVVYKGGRGPFGFKAGEMEQALVMTLLEQLPESDNPPPQTAEQSLTTTDDRLPTDVQGQAVSSP